MKSATTIDRECHVSAAQQRAASARRFRGALWGVQALLMLGLVAGLPHLVQQDAPRLIAIERIRRSLAHEGDASPFAAGLELADVPYQRPSTLFMRATEDVLSESAGLRLFVLATTALALGGWFWFAGALRASRRWMVALLLPLVFHRTHYFGFADYNLGLAMVPWAVGAALKFGRGGTTRSASRTALLLAILFASAGLCGIAHQIAVVPFGLFVGLAGLTFRRRPGRAAAVISAAAFAGVVGVVAPMLSAGSAETPRLWPWSWPPSINVVLAALDATSPSSGLLKGVHLLGLLFVVLGVRGYRSGRTRLSDGSAAVSDLNGDRPAPPEPPSLFATRYAFSVRSLGGPVAQMLLLASLALLAAYVALPSRMAPVSFISPRLVPFVFVGLAVALPARFMRNDRLLLLGVILLWVASLTLQLRAQCDYGALGDLADHLPRGTWVKVLVPTPAHVPTFPYVSGSFAWDEAGVLDPITRAGALTPDLYIPPGTFAIGYREEAVPLMWRAGTADRWDGDDVHRLQQEMPAIVFVGLQVDQVVPLLDRSVAGGVASGDNWTLWLRLDAIE
jgi:hypothetical protein